MSEEKTNRKKKDRRKMRRGWKGRIDKKKQIEEIGTDGRTQVEGR